MKIQNTFRPQQKRGAILPLTAISIIGLCGFLALSIDVGMLAVARAQVQDAADAAAICGARSLIGSQSNYVANSTAAAIAQATRNTILGTNINPAEVSVQQGCYHYNYATQTFSPEFPPGTGENYNLTQVTISHTYNTTFAKVLGVNTMTVNATSTAAHRPRDVAMVLDYSGSMNNESDLWNCESYLGSYLGTPNNPDPIFPQWGPYAPSFSPLATLQCTANSNLVGLCNVTAAVDGIPALVTNLFQNNRGQPAVAAFSAAPANVTNTAPAGDQYLNKKSSSTTALTWSQITGSQTTKFTGYAAQQGGTFYGYQQGPGYWGKTFFIWPPDPAAANDWRKKLLLEQRLDALQQQPHAVELRRRLEQPQRQLRDQLQGDSELDRQHRPEPVPVPTAGRKRAVLHGDSHRRAGVRAITGPTSTRRSPTRTSGSGRNTSTSRLGVWQDPTGNIQTPGNPSCSYGPGLHRWQLDSAGNM